jgi:hypothetical protein
VSSAGEDVAARADDLGLAEEAHAAHGAGLVGGGEDDLVLGGTGLVVQVEESGLAVLGHAGRAVGDTGGPGGQAGEDVGTVQGEAAGGFGEGLVVVDEHADASDGGVERVEGVARGVGGDLPGRQVDLAVAAEHPVAADTDGRVVALVAAVLAIAETYGHLRGEAGDLEDDRVVGLQRGRQRLRVGVAQVGEVAAERGVGQDEQPDTLAAGVVDEFGDLRQIEV